ncbi:DNA-processing protein DprA [Bacteroidales bacterium]|nr:DNA-processing protein DprA [Bacteroidales bacterium]
MHGDIYYKVALCSIPNIGSVLAKRLVSYTGSVEAVFKEKKRNLEKIPGIGVFKAKSILNEVDFVKVEDELRFIENYNVAPIFYLDKNYPRNLKECDDGPLMLFLKGNIDLQNKKIISIVGTRNASKYGEEFCEKFISDIKARYDNVIVLSGLAYGIDIVAHRVALKNNISTIGVLGHGLATLYPSIHRNTAKEMLENGGLLSEFLSFEKPERARFVRRNRIIAGLADATIVVESAIKGGALLTADMANSYYKEVFAVPGRVGDKYSEGCNMLLKSSQANMIESIDDFEYMMGWEDKAKQPVQAELFSDITNDEQQILLILEQFDEASVDFIAAQIKNEVHKVSVMLLQMEFKGMVVAIPGNRYRKSIK